MINNDTFRVHVLGEHIQFPLNPEERLRLWDNTKNFFLAFCEQMEEIADTLDCHPWLRPDIEKDISADDFRNTYECVRSMTEKLDEYCLRLLVDADNFAEQRHRDFIRDFGLEPEVFDAFAKEQTCWGEILGHPEWVAAFKQQEGISAEDTLNACAAFLLDWAENRKKDEAGFWHYTPPYERKAG